MLTVWEDKTDITFAFNNFTKSGPSFCKSRNSHVCNIYVLYFAIYQNTFCIILCLHYTFR